MSKRPDALTFEPSDGMKFFVLGEQGILFSEHRQELHLLDAAASYVWCGLRDGLSLADMVSDYAEACEISAQDAGQVVSDLLHRWLGLDYIHGDDIPFPSSVDFTTALGRLLVNPSLRKAFAADPRKTADRLGLRELDLPLLLDVEPAQLEELAASVDANQGEDRQHLLTADEPVARSAVLRYRTRKWSPPSVERFYRLCGSALRIGFDTPAQEDHVHCALKHLETAPVFSAIRLDLIAEERGHVILKDGEPAGYCAELRNLARTVLVLIRDIVLTRADFFIMIHGALVSTGDACVLLPAAAGSGKSTLTAALSRSGFQFFTDEIAMLAEDTMCARPFPFPIVVKNGSVEPLSPWYPEIADLPVTLRYDNQPIRFLPPHGSDLPVDDEIRQPVQWIVFPRYDATATTRLRPIGPEEALTRMLQECRMVNAHLNAGNVTGLIEWLRGVACYDLTLSSLDDAVPLMQRLCALPVSESADIHA